MIKIGKAQCSTYYVIRTRKILVNNQQQTQTHTVVQDELILVVKRQDLFPQGAWQGIKQVDDAAYAELIKEKKEFLPRSLMENDPTYKQIIPYLVFMHEGKLFLMQRTAKATETRLQSKFSLGIGGHIRQEDIDGSDIASWARREFAEEVSYNGSYTIEPLGILNDDTTAVGQVHVGFVYLLKGDSSTISVQEELKSGELLSFEECQAYYPRMELWSQIVFDLLKSF